MMKLCLKIVAVLELLEHANFVSDCEIGRKLLYYGISWSEEKMNATGTYFARTHRMPVLLYAFLQGWRYLDNKLVCLANEMAKMYANPNQWIYWH